MRKIKKPPFTDDEVMNQLLDKAHDRINTLQAENDFLQKGIDSREDAYDAIYKEKERQMALTKQIVYLFIIIDSLDKLTRNDCSSMSKVVRRALDGMRAELAEGMLSLPLCNLTNIINDVPYEE